MESDQPQEGSLHESTDASKQISQTESSKGFIPSAAALFFIDNLGIRRHCTLVCKTFGLLLMGLCARLDKFLSRGLFQVARPCSSLITSVGTAR